MSCRYAAPGQDLAAALALLAAAPQAAACSPNLANYGNCVRQQQEAQRMMIHQGMMQQQAQQGYRGGHFNDSFTRVVNTIEQTIYYAPVTIAAYTAQSRPYFYRTGFETPYNDIMARNWQCMEEEALEECNRKSGQAPCTLANLGVSNNGCIVMVKTDYKIYGDSDISGHNACGLAEQKAMQRCKKTDPKPKQCTLTHQETGR